MYINDKGIDDSGFHQGNAIYEKTSREYTDGKFVADQNNGTAQYVFDRSTYKYHYCHITPERNSFYEFTGASELEVTYTKGLFKKVMTVSPEPDGTYILKGGTKYTIKAKCPSGKFTVEQNNWVEAPNGGIWTPIKYSISSSISSGFGKPVKSGQMYVPSYKVFDAIELLSENSVKFERIESGNIKEQIEFILRNNGMKVTDDELNDALNSIKDAAGATVVLVIEGIAIPTTTLKTIAFIITGESNIRTFIGAKDGIATIVKYLEQCGFERACLEGDINVVSTHYISATLGNVWDGWTTAPYINKISATGDIGSVKQGVTPEQIVEWCNWNI